MKIPDIWRTGGACTKMRQRKNGCFVAHFGKEQGKFFSSVFFFRRRHDILTAEENGATDAGARTSGGKPSGWAV